MSRSPAGRKVVLIVEDDSDGRAIRELARKTHPGVRLDWLPANGIGNIKRNIARLIRLARDRLDNGQGCVAVVVDRDGNDPSRHEPHRTIANACTQQDVPLIACREAIEAWFLADPGCCKWLDVPLERTTHSLSDPKGKVSQAFYRKTRRAYHKRRARLELARQATGPDGPRNDSLAEAYKHLERCSSDG